MKYKPYKPEILQSLLNGLKNSSLPNDATIQKLSQMKKSQVSMVATDLAMSKSKFSLETRLEYLTSVLSSV